MSIFNSQHNNTYTYVCNLNNKIIQGVACFGVIHGR